MKRLSMFLIALLPVMLAAGTFDVTLNFAPSDFSFKKMNGYDVVALDNAYQTTEPGKPMLPLVTRSVLIPPDAEITGVEVVSASAMYFPGKYNVYPTQHAVSFSAKSLPPFVAPDAATYASTTLYPEPLVSFSPSGCLAGYRLADIRMTPLQYRPAAQTLRLSTKLTLRVTYANGVHTPFHQTASQQVVFGQEVSSLVVNPEKLKSWSPQLTPALDGQEVDMLVITDRSLAASFQPFADWKTKKGYKTKIMGTDSVYAHYPGTDNQTKIRNCITDYWQNYGLKYVVLGGDQQYIPCRLTHLTVEGTPGDIPADMYYADLQYSWDSDHDGYYGEMTDSVDLFHDVYVGRVPANRAGDVATFIRKDTMFEKHPDASYLKSLVLPSEMLWDPYHGKYVNNLIAATFPNGWKISKLEDPNSSQVPDSLRVGYELCHIGCHGNYDVFGSMMDVSQVPSITCGNKTSIINSFACLVGEFDDVECIAESLVRFSGGACVAAVLNSREGYGYPPALGPSEMIDLEYYRNLNYKDCYELGAMNARSKDYYHALSMDQEVWRWCIYELTLFGDPTLPVWTETPAMMNVTYSGSIQSVPQVMRVSVTSSGSPLGDAQVCLMQGASVYASGRTNSLGWVELLVSPDTGKLNVTVTAHNYYPHEGFSTVGPASGLPAITLQSVRVDDTSGNHNGKLDPGETVTLYLALRNSGLVMAPNLQGVLRKTSGYLTLSDSVNSYGTLNAGDTGSGSGYVLTAASNTPPGTQVELYVHATSNAGIWDPFTKLTVGTAPENHLWADHDTGNCILSVTSYGSIGTIGPYNEGTGFKYPRAVSDGSLYESSFMAGTDSTYVVDRFYGHPSSTINNDWRILDSIHRVLPPEAGAQEYRAIYDDGGHPHPKGLTVKQWSASTALPGYDDFVVLQFDLWDFGASPISGLYAGIMTDFDVYNVQNNALKSDTVRRLTYMYDPAGSGEPYVGVRLLYPTIFANLGAIRNSTYITPSSMMSEAVKDSLLRGRINVRNSTSTTNWSEVVSAGPFTIPVNWYQRTAFAFVGGTTENEIKAFSDSAQSWYNRSTGITEPAFAPYSSSLAASLTVEPFLAHDVVRIAYRVEGLEPVTISAFDLTGKLVTRIFSGVVGSAAGGSQQSASFLWPTGSLRNGVYFIKLASPAGTETAKVIIQ